MKKEQFKITQEELEKAKKEYFEKGGQVEKLETKFSNGYNIYVTSNSPLNILTRFWQ